MVLWCICSISKEQVYSFHFTGSKLFRMHVMMIHVFCHTAAYHAEKVNSLRESKAPAYSFGLKTGLIQMKSTTPSPNSYTLPSLMGSNIVGKRSNAAYSMTGRSKIGSFHEDLRKVRLLGHMTVSDYASAV